MTSRIRRRLIAAGLCCAVTVLALLGALFAKDWFFSFYPAFSRALMRLLAAVSSVFPFALWEFALYALIVWALVSLVLAILRRRKLQWLSGLLCGLCLGAGAFVCFWGLNHFGPSIDEKLGLEIREYSVEELAQATAYYLKLANETAGEVARNEDGTMNPSSFSELAAQAGEGYETLRESYDCFGGSTAPVKRVAAWYPMSRFGITGIFVCLTGESTVNPDTYAASLPFTMCHEIGHRMAVAAENEANFCAFLACEANSSAEFRYSGYYSAFIYCYNALYKVSPKTARQFWSYASDGVIADCAAANAHYEQYEGKVQDAAQKVNDVYLKTFQEQSGVQSYGEVADLLIAYYLEKTS